MSSLYVTDTTSIVSYFNKEFGVPQILSNRARNIIRLALSINPSGVKLSIPSVVFLEIFDKWFENEENANRIRYNIFEQVNKSPNIEIKPIEQEVLETILTIGDELNRHDMHDKIILASAIMMNCPLITTDTPMIEYIKQHPTIPYIN